MLFKTKKREHNKLDAQIKKSVDFYFDDLHWTIRYVVAETGSEFTGSRVLIAPYALTEVFKKEHLITADLPQKEIKDSPLLDSDKLISHQCEVDYSQYYGSPHYWGGSGCWGMYPTMIGGSILTNTDYQKDEDISGVHLRSINEVVTYRIHATDGEVGYVEDFIIDDKTWAIRYLIVNTRSQRSGKKVLISPALIERLSWADSEIFVNLTRKAIVSAPEYTEKAALKRDYELSRY